MMGNIVERAKNKLTQIPGTSDSKAQLLTDEELHNKVTAPREGMHLVAISTTRTITLMAAATRSTP